MSAQGYLSRGVSPTKDEVKEAVKGQSKGIFPGAFAKIIPDLAGDPDYCTAVHADGAGTKSSAAYLMYKETGSREWFAGIAQDSLVMNTDDLAAVGAVTGFYLSNTIGRNAHRVDGASIAKIIEGYDKAIAALGQYGSDILMTGGETADVGDLVKTVIVDSTAVVRMKREDVLDLSNLTPSLVIVGLASFGKALYEEKENSGISSNGLTAARHALFHKSYLEKYPESISETIPEDKIYCGKFLLEDPLPGSSLTVGEAVLSPTRSYLPILKDVFDNLGRGVVKGIVHCTGGGQVKCRDFGQGLLYIKDSLFERPAIFEAIYGSGEFTAKEMYQIFNMGHRMELYCKPEDADALIEISRKYGVAAQVIGRVEASPLASGENQVIIRDRGLEFVY